MYRMEPYQVFAATAHGIKGFQLFAFLVWYTDFTIATVVAFPSKVPAFLAHKSLEQWLL